jgi:tetratricopeptide (TPR) repeat protein
MAEEEQAARGERGDASSALLAAALASVSSNPKVDALIERQTKLADLQIEDMERDLKLRHWSLRFGNVSAVMKVAFEIALAFVMLAIAGLVALAIWTAAHDDGLVIEAFNVPSDMAAKGFTGQVLATQVQDRIAFIQSHADTLRAASTFRNNWGNDIKVQIPDTGVSVGEAYRFLANWVGHETHITGEVWRDTKGIALSARAGNVPAKVFRGPEADLDALITQAAEYVYWQTQPYRYTVFLDENGRRAESLAYTKALALYGPQEDRAWAYSRWGLKLETFGDLKGALEKQRIAATLDPDLPHPYTDIEEAELGLGHDESALYNNGRAISGLQNGGSRQYAGGNAATALLTSSVLRAEITGEFADAIALAPEIQRAADFNKAHRSASIMLGWDLARNHDVSDSLKADAEAPNEEVAVFRMMDSEEYSWDVPPLPQAMRAAALDDWRGVRDDLLAADALAADQPHAKAFLPATAWPWLAYANARLGDVQAAQVLIDKTALDCYLCVRMRGNIEVAQKNWSKATGWFAEAVKQAPSIPFAYADWGAMLLAKGDFDGAIAKFKVANAKSPHFADPLEMWGEALMLKNRSDLALAKFEEASKYAPNWGRLHLKWGEALFYTGDKTKDEAKKQLAMAATLDLSSADKGTLSNWMKLRG